MTKHLLIFAYPAVEPRVKKRDLHSQWWFFPGVDIPSMLNASWVWNATKRVRFSQQRKHWVRKVHLKTSPSAITTWDVYNSVKSGDERKTPAYEMVRSISTMFILGG